MCFDGKLREVLIPNLMYAAYLLETQSKHMLETPHGFLTYGFNCVPGVSFPHCYVEDIWIKPEHRKEHHAARMADKVADIARERGVTKMLGSVSLCRKNADANLEVLKHYGMRLFAAHEQTIFTIKDL
jgi:ribosomal protein S18 acetylase RimI-like enzyme